jgi:GT2 family glycosyltransferase
LEHTLMRLSVIVPAFNEVATTRQSIASLLANTAEPDFELVFVNDGSTDETPTYAAELQARLGPRFVYVAHPENRGVCRAWDSGLLASNAPTIAFNNNDILYSPEWERGLLNALERDSRLAVVSPLSTHGPIPADWPKGAGRGPNPAGYMGYMPLLGCCFMCRRSLFDEIGLFPKELTHYFSDNWIALASQSKGYECGYAADSYIHHLMGISSRKLSAKWWGIDGPAFEKLAKPLGVMRPYLLRNGQKPEDLPITGVK